MSYQPQHVYDAIRSHPDHRDFLAPPADTNALPDRYTLPPVPILDQSNEGSCVGHGCAGARETLELAAAVPVNDPARRRPKELLQIYHAEIPVPLSRAFIYYKARAYEHATKEDAGAEVRDGCKVMQKIGVCTEEQFPYKVGDFAHRPPAVDVKAAAAYKIGSYTRLTSTAQMRAAIFAGQPVVIGIAVYESFERVGADGVCPLPDVHRESLLGGHCLYVRGWRPDPQRSGKFLYDTPNSWSASFADHGVMYLPQDYLDNPGLCSDLWALSLV